MAARRLPGDWQRRYNYAPVLLKTFVERDRFTGPCYRCANWIHVGHTRGRAKLDQTHKATLPTKDVWLLPIRKDFRARLST